MKADQYKNELKERLEGYFDVFEDREWGGLGLDLLADYHRRNERFFIKKSMNLYAYENHEHFILKIYDGIDLTKIKADVEILTQEALQRTKPSEEHMSTDYTIVLHVPALTAELEDWVRRFQFRKAFQFGLKGRIHLGLAATDELGKTVFSKDRREKRYRFLEIKEALCEESN